jgi:predicted hotdog family 3-hydroxylacyl-ACP dehydratase
MIATKEKVKDLIPQKHPFVMVDELLEYTEKSLTSRFLISPENIFSHKGIFAEAGLIEHMAQSVALHTGYYYFLKKKDVPIGYIGAIKKVNILRLPKINEILETKVKILHEFMGIFLVEIEVFINNISIATCQMKTVLQIN